MMKKNIYVTRPSLPPLEEFIPYLEKIWANNILTNGGPYHQQLENELCDYLGINYISLFSNGTIALLTALQALDIKGEVITTPYSFVATAHSLIWNRITPVFVDIDPQTLNLDPRKITAALTSKTTAILPVHCYGRMCDVEGIQQVAAEHNLKIIYDAAHAFGVRDKHGSIFRYGNLSVLSFHATKIFNTFEGGAIISHDLATKQKIDNLKNFGFVDEVTVTAAGINGKMSEINSAFGLLQLKHIDRYLDKRKKIYHLYLDKLSNIAGIKILAENKEITSNYSYFPILIGDEYPISRDKIYNKLKDNNIFARRYFYPLISDFPIYQGFPSADRGNLPFAVDAANRIICLPMHPELHEEDINKIVNVLRLNQHVLIH